MQLRFINLYGDTTDTQRRQKSAVCRIGKVDSTEILIENSFYFEADPVHPTTFGEFLDIYDSQATSFS